MVLTIVNKACYTNHICSSLPGDPPESFELGDHGPGAEGAVLMKIMASACLVAARGGRVVDVEDL